MKIGICNDHAGVAYKKKLMKMLRERGIEVVNYGTDSEVSCDYPDFAHRLAEAVESGEVELGIALCGTGNGMAITLNKHQGIRAGLQHRPHLAGHRLRRRPPPAPHRQDALPMSFFQPAPGTVLSHDITDYPDGIVLPIDKPYRWTSADVIRKVKFAAFRHFRKKNLKVGHAGTLDPLATGVLLVCLGPACKRAQEFQDHDKEYVCLGPACKRAQEFQDHDKEYVAGIRFGATTPSYDLEKEVDRTFPHDQVTEEAVRAVLPSFLGPQEQVAPLFSAKSVDGVRAYEMARKLYRNAQKGILDPDFDAAALETLHRSRITISELELLDFVEASAVPSRTNFFSPEKRSKKSCPTPDADAACSETVLSADTPTVISSEVEKSASSRINVADTSSLGLPEARIRIACSKGTYIRAFARDLGEALGTGAHLSGLVRTKTGAFRLEDALSLEEALDLLASD